MTGIVVDYDKRKHAASVVIGDGEQECAVKVQVQRLMKIGEEITFQTKQIIYEFMSSKTNLI